MDELIIINGKTFGLRPASNADREGIMRLVRAILPEFGEEYDEHGSESDLTDLEKTYMGSGGTFLVLSDGAYIIGTLGIVPVGPGSCKLRKMYVDAGYRKLGLGQFMLDTILKRARALGFARIMLETITSMEAAVAMYEKTGFTRIDLPSVSARCDIVMEKEL